jgi:hypothetical protein
MKRIALVILACGTVALAAWQLAPGDSARATTRSKTDAPVANSHPTASNSNAGYVVHFDDKGKIVEAVSPQDQADFNAQLNAAINTSSEGLVEQVNPVAGGGIKLDLQGRFQSAQVATKKADGSVYVPCLTNEGDVRAFTSATAANAATKK